VRGIETDRREHRQHLAIEIAADPGALRLGELGAAEEPDALSCELRDDDFLKELVLPLDEPVGDRGDAREHLSCGHAVRTDAGHGELDLLLQTADAHLEELVQIRADDAEKAQALERRHTLVLGLREHTPVEFEDAEFAVEEAAVGRGEWGSGLDEHADDSGEDVSMVHDGPPLNTTVISLS